MHNRSSLFGEIEEKRGVAPTSAPSLDAENIFGVRFRRGKILGELLKHIKVDDMAGETAKNILGVSQKHIFFVILSASEIPGKGAGEPRRNPGAHATQGSPKPTPWLSTRKEYNGKNL